MLFQSALISPNAGAGILDTQGHVAHWVRFPAVSSDQLGLPPRPLFPTTDAAQGPGESVKEGFHIPVTVPKKKRVNISQKHVSTTD